MNTELTKAIRSNNFKVYLLMGLMTIIIGILGSLISAQLNWGLSGTGVFLIISGVMNYLAFFYSDKMVVYLTGAKPVSRAEAPNLYQITEELVRKMNLPMPKLYLLNDQSINAFATGRNYHKAVVAVSAGLLSKATSEEIKGVVAHELSHIQNYDMRTMAIVGILAGFISLLADLFWRATAFSGNDNKNGYLVMVGIALSILAPISAFFIQMAISRKREFVADATAVKVMGDKGPMINALKRIEIEATPAGHYSPTVAHLFFSSTSSSVLANLFSTHPPLGDRIKALESLR